MGTVTDDLVTAVRAALAAGGDPERAAQQQRYMKSALPYRGYSAPELKALLRPLLASYQPTGRAAWEATVRSLWDDATHREERYAAIAVARHRQASAWLAPESVPLFRHLVVTGAWWDLVDETAQHLVRPALARHRSGLTPTMQMWATDADLWVRRTAVICQLGRRADTDTDLLALRGRRERRRPDVLAAQGDRVGAARLRPHRPRLGARRGAPARGPDVRPLTT